MIIWGAMADRQTVILEPRNILMIHDKMWRKRERLLGRDSNP